MVTAAIKINGVIGSNDGLTVGVSANLSNSNNTGVTSWSWQFVSRPPGSLATILTPTSPTASFVPDVVGSYLIRLTIIGGSDSDTDEVVGAVLTPNLSMRIPAAREESEFDAIQGWAEAIHTAMIALDTSAGGTHGIGSSTHTPSTLAQLNSKISDATLDDASSTRSPTTHGLSSTAHSSTTLAALNAKISDANLDDSGSSRSPSGTASGDLSGTYPGPSVVRIQGQSVSGAGPSQDDVLVFNAGVWTPTAVSLTGNTLDLAYDEGGPGAGRSITADSGAVFIDATGGSALEMDGYLNLREISDPAAQSNRGLLYVKDDGGDSELFFMDDSGNAVQLTRDGSIDVSLVANTLDGAYDQGGPGAGRVIIADSGPVLISLGANNHGLEIAATAVTSYSSNAIYADVKAGVDDVEGVLVTFDSDGFNNGRAIQGVITPGTISAGEEAVALSGVATGVDAAADSEIVAIRGGTSGATSGKYIGVKLAGSDWHTAFHAESGHVRVSDGYVALSEITDPDAVMDTGSLYTKNDSGDTELYYRDNQGRVVKVTEDGVVNASGAGNKLGQAYNQGGPGVGRVIDAYDGPVYIHNDGYEVLEIKGVIGLDEQTLVPVARADAGYLYSAEVDGYSELFYMDNYGSALQVTSDGYLNTYESLRGVGLYVQRNPPAPHSIKGFLYTAWADGYVELFYNDAYGNRIRMSERGEAVGAGGNLQLAYNEGRTIIVRDFEPVHLIASDAYDSYEALRVDGYLGFDNVIDHPEAAVDRGFVYIKDDSGDSELFYMDDLGRIVQITKDGFLNADEIATHNTLDQSYDEGGAGAGRIIYADAGPVFIYATGDTGLRLESTDDLGGQAIFESEVTAGGNGQVANWFQMHNDGYFEPRNIVSDMNVSVPSGGSYTAVGITSDIRPYPTNPADSTLMSFKADVHGLDTPREGTFIAFKAESSGAPLAQFHYALHADVGGIWLGDGDIVLDGYVSFEEQAGDPTYQDDFGTLYTKEADGYTELFYIDNFGSVTQMTEDGYLAGASKSAQENLDSTGTETYIALSYTPLLTPDTDSGRELQVYRNGILLRWISTLGADPNRWTYNPTLNRVEFVASGSSDWYTAIYNRR